MNDIIYTILKEMCTRVNVDIKDVDFKKDRWYEDYTWTTEEQDRFIEWFIIFLQKSIKHRRALLKNPYIKTKKKLLEAIYFFLLEYGWKIKDVK